MTFTTGGQIEAITWNTSQGFSTALSAFIAQNYAAGRVERVLRAWYTTLWMTGIFGTFCTLLFVFFGNEVFAIFVPEQAAYEAGGVFLRIDGYSQLFMMLEITIDVYKRQVVTCALIVTVINNITSTKKDRILFNINVVD